MLLSVDNRPNQVWWDEQLAPRAGDPNIRVGVLAYFYDFRAATEFATSRGMGTMAVVRTSPGIWRVRVPLTDPIAALAPA